ncbi:MAG: BamA/TamA family outer membrane protein [Sphingobacteriales bacterium JAD_PAG50586_3]|nr:MAG: BamA/TamA family outer membrane protein [Sphingobacteriales bacterium JAD_PAG50586_3]
MQGQSGLTIIPTDSTAKRELKKYKVKKQFANTADRKAALQGVLLDLYNRGYLAASYDSIKGDSIKQKAYLHAGLPYTWAQIKHASIDEGILNRAGFKEKFYTGKPVSFKEVTRLQESIVKYCEDNGYPFANVKLDSITIDTAKAMQASLVLEKGKMFKIDSIVVKGTSKISKPYLYSYLGVRPGDLYSESEVQRIALRIKELPFVKEIKPAEVLFGDKGAKIVLYIDDRKASTFNGILGFLPNSDPTKTKPLLTGELHLKLNNALNRGELIDINWRKLQAATQYLDVKLAYPYLFSTNFGLDGNLNLYKRDTTFLNLVRGIGVQYLLKGGNYLKFFVENRSSTLLNTVGLENVQVLPPNADISTTLYGVEIRADKLDYRYNPRKGYSIYVKAGIGAKNIKRNDKINPEVYEGLKLRSTQVNSELQASYYFPLSKRSVIKTGVQAGYQFNQNLFVNELYRLGGLNLLRGYTDESVFVSGYSIFTLEYRFLLEQNSYLFAFTDGGYYQRKVVQGFNDFVPYSFGAGISFETKIGIFSLAYALGNEFDNNIQFRNAKIHFGITNYFK